MLRESPRLDAVSSSHSSNRRETSTSHISSVRILTGTIAGCYFCDRSQFRRWIAPMVGLIPSNPEDTCCFSLAWISRWFLVPALADLGASNPGCDSDLQFAPHKPRPLGSRGAIPLHNHPT